MKPAFKDEEDYKLKKWIDVNGKKMDSVEFARFIRVRTTPKINKMIKKRLKKEHKNNIKLKRLQEND